MEDRLHIIQIFRSIQGESTWAGLPCSFVRLAGCPLNCRWCDTREAHGGGRQLNIRTVMEELAGLGERLVQITGGEPLAQSGTPILIGQLLNSGYTVLVETSGALDISAIDARAHRIVDIKCPGSGETEKNLWTNLEHLTGRDELKFVVADRADYEWARDILERYQLEKRLEDQRLRAILFSPVWEVMEPQQLAGWILEDHLGVRLQLQLHKLIWEIEAGHG